MERIVKTLLSADGRRRLEIYQRDDGHFGFADWEAAIDLDGNPCWTPASISEAPICDTADTAEREARARIDWLRISN